jgi:hypothetical protein
VTDLRHRRGGGDGSIVEFAPFSIFFS